MHADILDDDAYARATTERLRVDRSRSDAAIDELVQELIDTRTDLAKLVRRVHERNLHIVAVPRRAVDRWQKDAPGGWERVHRWLTTRRVRVVHL